MPEKALLPVWAHTTITLNISQETVFTQHAERGHTRPTSCARIICKGWGFVEMQPCTNTKSYARKVCSCNLWCPADGNGPHHTMHDNSVPQPFGHWGRVGWKEAFPWTRGGVVPHAACIPLMGLCLFARPGFWHAATQCQSMDQGLEILRYKEGKSRGSIFSWSSVGCREL